MEKATIAALLEKYWRAETTVEEERQLADYFRQSSIPPEWEPLRNVFAFFEAEAQVTPGKEFEEKLMERIRQIGDASADLSASTDLSAGSDLSAGTNLSARADLSARANLSARTNLSAGRQSAPPPAPVRLLSRRTPWWAAAAVIILALGISRLQGPRPAVTPAHPLAQTAPAFPSSQVTTIKDTYEDPQQALAAIQKALHTAASKINHGKTMAQKQIDRMNDGWQSALTN
ncbi:MAG TPA: hypothetical protein VL832_19870 [Puia sp.]|nr:hypothetical protein [Puia sp.]